MPKSDIFVYFTKITAASGSNNKIIAVSIALWEISELEQKKDDAISGQMCQTNMLEIWLIGSHLLKSNHDFLMMTLITPAWTHSISGLKSRVLKFTFLA